MGNTQNIFLACFNAHLSKAKLAETFMRHLVIDDHYQIELPLGPIILHVKVKSHYNVIKQKKNH